MSAFNNEHSLLSDGKQLMSGHHTPNARQEIVSPNNAPSNLFVVY